MLSNWGVGSPASLKQKKLTKKRKTMKTLKEKIDFAIKLIQSAEAKAKQVGQPIEVCYSGGKDSDVIMELVRMAKVEYRAIYKNTTIDPPGTIKHCRERGVEIMRPKYSFGQIIQKTGFPSRYRLSLIHI